MSLTTPNNDSNLETANEDDDDTCLSEHALKALLEFYAEREESEFNVANVSSMPSEQWQLSQFWYTNETCNILSQEAFIASSPNYKIACVSCPSLCLVLHARRKEDFNLQSSQIICFEIFGDEFEYFDYNDPLNFRSKYASNFDLVVADPPFLSQECIHKFSQAIKYLAKEKIIICTGAVVSDLTKDLLKVHQCKFQPKHTNKLANEFVCLTNYPPFVLNS